MKKIRDWNEQNGQQDDLRFNLNEYCEVNVFGMDHTEYMRIYQGETFERKSISSASYIIFFYIYIGTMYIF